MAKSLEEHLYRSAQTKEEYLDLSTLKKRLQMIAHGLELHRSTSSGSAGSSKQNDGMGQQPPSQQQQLLQQMASGNLSGGGGTAQQLMRQASSGQQGNMVGGDNQLGSGQHLGLSSSMFSGGDPLSGNGGALGGSSGMPGGDSSKYQDPIAAQKKKVIRQQQQRLLLLRHASKCAAGPTCKTKFCAQMVTLWKHMKKCRDKNCSTSHCLSSRCVLNHYRICKSQGRTSSCEVCGPVMEQIKRQETGDEVGAADPLTKDHEMPMLDNSMPMEGNNNSAQVQQQQGSGEEQQQLQQLQVAQMKLQNQLQVLKQLQRQQEQLLQQQRHLQEQQSQIKDPHTQQGQQLQQQQALLQQLQQRCQQQQVMLQQELAVQSNAINSAKQKQANQAMSGDSKQIDEALPGPTLASSSIASNAKETSSRRGSATRKGGKGKTARKSGKGKSIRQAVDDSLNSKAESQMPKSPEHKPSTPTSHSKRRLSITGNGMPEAARKMIKLEPHKNDDDDNKNESQAGDERKLFGDIDDNEAKKRLVLDDMHDGDAEPHLQHPPTMSRESIEKHLESLEKPSGMSPEEVTKHCLPLILDLIEDPFGWVFRDRVDPEALGLPDYFEVVKKPMHLELVKTNLEDNLYNDLESFQKDCSLVFENSILYNGESSEVGQLALTMLSNFAEKYEATVTGMLKS